MEKAKLWQQISHCHVREDEGVVDSKKILSAVETLWMIL